MQYFAAFVTVSVSTQRTGIIYEHFQSAHDHVHEYTQNYLLYTALLKDIRHKSLKERKQKCREIK